jgi:hypothetical protein
LNPVAMKSLRFVGYPIEHTSPQSRTTDHSSGWSRSMATMPIARAARQNSGSGID